MTHEKAMAIILKKINLLDETLTELRIQTNEIEDQVSLLEDRFNAVMESEPMFIGGDD